MFQKDFLLLKIIFQYLKIEYWWAISVELEKYINTDVKDSSFV